MSYSDYISVYKKKPYDIIKLYPFCEINMFFCIHLLMKKNKLVMILSVVKAFCTIYIDIYILCYVINTYTIKFLYPLHNNVPIYRLTLSRSRENIMEIEFRILQFNTLNVKIKKKNKQSSVLVAAQLIKLKEARENKDGSRHYMREPFCCKT